MMQLCILLTLLTLLGIVLSFRGQQPDQSRFGILNTNALKGVLAIAVILGHVSTRVMIPLGYEWARMFGILGIFSVTIFFFISGYGLMQSYQKKGATYFQGFLRKRVTGTFIPLALASIFLPLLHYAVTESSINHKLSTINLTSGG